MLQCAALRAETPPEVLMAGHTTPVVEPVWQPPEPQENSTQFRANSEESIPLLVGFEDGVSFHTPDEVFALRIRLMEQTDFKLFIPRNQQPARPGVYIPRFRIYFEGNISKSFEYEMSLQRSIEGQFDLLDANIDFRPSEEFQIRIGRFLVPYSYDWYDHLEQFFITPERGLYPLNFGLSREAGIMFWGELNEDALQYAIGWFSGQIAGLADTNTTQDFVAYLNVRPFAESRNHEVRYINVGVSGAIGDQAFPGEALPMRTSIQSSENDEAAQAASAIFLEFEEGVEVLGTRDQGAIHAAWYIRGLSLESEYEVGRFGFRNHEHESGEVTVYGYQIAVAYFITGEEVTERTVVIPLRPFDPASGCHGIGAIEPFVRFSHLSLGEEIFESDLANPDDWTRTASTIDMGWNWYPNRYIKFYFDWQISLFDTPVLINADTGERRKNNHLFWLRGQVYY